MNYRNRRLQTLLGSILLTLCAITVLGLSLAILVDLLLRGGSRLSLDFLWEAPREGGRRGGIGPILVSTAAVLGVCLAAAVPVALGCAVWLTETVGAPRTRRFFTALLDVLAGVPSIVFGLFGNAFFCVQLGLGFSILSGGLTLACMCLPLLIQTWAAGFRAVPGDQRISGAALGWSRWAILRHLVLPQARPALVAGLILALGRALAETAALMFTAGYVDRWPQSISDSGRVLSLHIYDLAMNVPGGESSAAATAIVLLLFSAGLTRLFHALHPSSPEVQS